MTQPDIAALEKTLGHHFRKSDLIWQALTHSSHAHEALEIQEESEQENSESSVLRDNEMLEFLGDAVLGFITSQALFERFPGKREGELSKLRAHLVSARHL